MRAVLNSLMRKLPAAISKAEREERQRLTRSLEPPQHRSTWHCSTSSQSACLRAIAGQQLPVIYLGRTFKFVPAGTEGDSTSTSWSAPPGSTRLAPSSRDPPPPRDATPRARREEEKANQRWRGR